MKTLRTERLLLRPMQPNDLSFFVRVHADPRVARFLSTGRPRTSEETRAWFERVLLWERRYGVSQLCVLSRAGERHLGRCGLSLFEVEAPGPSEDGRRPERLRAFYGPDSAPDDVSTTREAEIGYLIDSAAWGEGYATEAAGAIRDYALEQLRLPRVMSLVHPQNLASVRVAEKTGLTHYDTLDVFGRNFERYVLERDG